MSKLAAICAKLTGGAVVSNGVDSLFGARAADTITDDIRSVSPATEDETDYPRYEHYFWPTSHSRHQSV